MTVYKAVRIFNGILMMGFASLQLNDPDPFVWVALYVLTAVLAWFGSHRQNRLRVLLCVMYSIIAAWTFPEEYQGVGEMDAYHPEIEQAREALGLCIASGIHGLNAWLFSRGNILKMEGGNADK